MFLVCHKITLVKFYFAMGKTCKHVKTPKDYFMGLFYILVPYSQPFQILRWRMNYSSHILASVYKTLAHYLPVSAFERVAQP